MPSQSETKRRLTTTNAPVKRFRVSRACDQCRTAREKCDGNQPSCHPCIESKRECTYTSNPRKRGLQPGYIRSLETTLAFIFQRHPEIEALVDRQLSQENSILMARGTKESNQLHKTWRKSKFCKDITKVLAGEQLDVSPDRIPSSDDDSEIDMEDASLIHMIPGVRHEKKVCYISSNFKLLFCNTCKQPSWISETDITTPIQATAALTNSHPLDIQQPVTSSTPTPLPDDHWKLLEAYSTYTQCWLPMCEKLDILKLSYSYPEHGLVLSHDMLDSGHHAEMWSIFAVGCIQDLSNAGGAHEDQCLIASTKLYAISRSLIPDEVGDFDLNHIKALLNLAIFNIRRSFLKAAWLLVGAASRIFLTLREELVAASPRRKNILASCFLLDNLLALYFQQRPYLSKSDLAWASKIEEDGMEEWQPWAGDFNSGTMGQSRLPTLALSSFNNLLELVDILVSTTQQSTARNFLHEMIGRLEIWKSSLPPKLDYIRSDRASIPLTPPAVLLQLTYLATAFALVPSQAWLQRILDLLESLRTRLGLTKIPSIIICLLETVKRSSTNLVLDEMTSMRLHHLFIDFDQACATPSGEVFSESQSISKQLAVHSPDVARMQDSTMNHISPQSFSTHLAEPVQKRYSVPSGSSTLLDELLPDMNHSRQENAMQSLNSPPFNAPNNAATLEASVFDPNDPYNAFISGDLDNFFDEISSLHGAKKLENQSQFMQNLGFSSEASMADLLAADPNRFMPMPPSNVDLESQNEPQNFQLNAFYDSR